MSPSESHIPCYRGRPSAPALALLALLGLLTWPGQAAAQHSLGPLTAEEGAPLQRLGFTTTVEGPRVTPRGALRAEVWLGYGNVWEQDSSAVANVYLDLERLIVAPTVRVGLTHRLEVGVRATVERTGGGFLDGAVTGLHGLLGAGDRNRPDYPEGGYGQWLRDGDGALLVEIPQRTRPTLEDVRIFAKMRVWSSGDGHAAVAAKAAVRVPTADNLRGGERTDGALLLMGQAPWRGFFLHALVGASTVRASPELAGVLRNRQWTAMIGAERPVTEHLALVVQATGSTQLLRDFGDHDVDGALTNVVFGVVWRRGPWRWEAAMQEDAPARGPSTDFTLQLGVGRAW